MNPKVYISCHTCRHRVKSGEKQGACGLDRGIECLRHGKASIYLGMTRRFTHLQYSLWEINYSGEPYLPEELFEI